MRIVGQRSGSGVTQTPRHPEVNEKSPTGLEPNNQILAATLEGFDPFAFEFGGDRNRLERTDKARIIDLDSLEPTADEVRLERETNRLDLG
jgi:hypothetical protein